MLIDFDIPTLHEAAKEMAMGNEESLAACAGHVFCSLNRFSPYYACDHCNGIVHKNNLGHEQVRA